MADVVREIERKYEITEFTGTDDTGETGGPKLPGLAVRGVDSVADRGTVQLDAVYYDTEDGRLAADGITLRRRTGGSDSGWHLKLPVEPGVRDEIRAPLTDVPPRALVALVRSRIRERGLVPVMRLRSERRVRHLLDGSGTLLAEVAVDRVRAERLPDGGTAGWTEVEAELGEAGGTDLLDRMEKRLLKAGLRRASAASKLERALASTAPRSAPGSASGVKDSAPVTAGDCVLRYVRAQVAALVELDPAVRRDLPDSVHRMRVATRRLRSCFRSYGRFLDRAVTDPLGDELKWLAGELGYDRDREVLTARLSERIGELPRPLLLGPVRGRLRTFSHSRRAGTRSQLIAVLDGRRHLALLDALDALLAAPPLLPQAAAVASGPALAKVVDRDVERLAVRVREAIGAPPGEARDTAMHSARKAAKRARYAAEAARPAYGRTAKRYAARMTSVQELLGEHQDSVLARQALREIALQAHAAGEQSFSYGVMYEREVARAAECERELPDLWHAVLAALRTSPLGSGPSGPAPDGGAASGADLD
ncbi:CYTH and CHAD domain-containing protein [Streptomyces sp. N2-109]|uniref:CYTH and CHAD domain-containing protein n=1 Tax=Streptomyces gossypii TaxID=2883101 RepID=A0ABT2JRC6_9ACTN|nr:CYTH and CHAD domain-containing protein [Streptomyces gossypii]MCT2590447.1 CYTH and CHAD domain-containing protein [Streptomyces gossypii]